MSRASARRVASRAVGKRLQQFFHSPEIRALAPPATRSGGSPWMLGGCLIAAEAIQNIYGGKLIGLDADGGEKPGDDVVHVVVTHGGGYLDALGFHRSLDDIQAILDDEYSLDQPVFPVPGRYALKSGIKQDKKLSDTLADLFTTPKTARMTKRDATRFVDEGMVGENWGSAASGVLVTDGSRVLLLKRSPHVEDPGLWGIPGGAIPVDYGSGRPMDAKKSAFIEAKEEMGGIPSGSVAGKHVFRGSGDFTFTTFVWKVDPETLDQFTPRLNWEHTDWKVEDIEDVGSGTHPGVVWVLKKMGPGRVARRAGREHYPGQVDKRKLNAFMSDYKGMTYPPFMQDMRIWVDDPKDPDAPYVMTELKPFDGYISFHAIYSADKQGAGLASGVIKKLTAIADKHGVSMTLDAKPFSTIDNQLKKSDLIGWYKRHGWIRRPDYGDSSSMIRYPGGSRTPPARTASFTRGRI